MNARRLSGDEIDAILRQRRAEAKASYVHRALPLDVVEAKARAARVAWPQVCNACNVGIHGNCDCLTDGASESGIEAEPAYRPIKRIPPRVRTYTWPALFAFATFALIVWAGKP